MTILATPCALRVATDELLQCRCLRREGGDVALPGSEEWLLVRDHVAARARLEAEYEGLQRVRGRDDLLGRARLSPRIAQVADREQHCAEDERDENREHAAGDEQALAEGVMQARVASLVRPGSWGTCT